MPWRSTSRTGEIVHFGPDRRFPLASVIKLPIAAYAFALADAGKLDLAQPFPVAREEMTEPGILAEHFRHPGVAISTLNAIELSITQSDNGATDLVLKRVGGPAAVNAWLASKGMAGLNVGNHMLKQVFADPPPAALPDERTATPRAMAQFLAELHKGRLLKPASTATLLDILGRTAGERIKLHLPAHAEVRHKTGTLFGQGTMSVNDVGYILSPGADPIAIAIFITDSPQSVAHNVRDNVIGHIARSIFDYFELGRSKR